MIDLSLIVVSYNTAALTRDCLESVQAADTGERELFVIDNASADGSARLIEERFPSVRLIANTRNLGFAAANNQALPGCQGRYLFFLNPDTQVRPDAFARAVSFMDANPQIGLAGCRIVNPDGSPQESVSLRYPGQKHCRGELDGLPGRIACVLGAAMIARTGLVRNIGGFDESFFLYGEEQDLALRIRQSGFEIGFIPDAVVVHHGGQSESPANPAATWEKKVRAENIFYRKHYRPETIRRIHREELLKAAWRRATLRLSLPFTRDPEKVRAKLIRYETIARITRETAVGERGTDGP
ncbi:MAG: glycosyltransferase family 2 protein [Deltaproteobacteria bacterium]|nr:glycosyltransferase family 2 protein [Deltaproteobacteria bacterium]